MLLKKNHLSRIIDHLSDSFETVKSENLFDDCKYIIMNMCVDIYNEFIHYKLATNKPNDHLSEKKIIKLYNRFINNYNEIAKEYDFSFLHQKLQHHYNWTEFLKSEDQLLIAHQYKDFNFQSHLAEIQIVLVSINKNLSSVKTNNKLNELYKKLEYLSYLLEHREYEFQYNFIEIREFRHKSEDEQTQIHLILVQKLTALNVKLNQLYLLKNQLN